jgi:DNA-directed RNA polymerase alpha subunit
LNIRDLNIDKRVRNALLSSDILTTEQLCLMTELDVWKLPNMGRKSVARLQYAIAAHGLSFAGRRAETPEQLDIERREMLIRRKFAEIQKHLNELKGMLER